MPFNSLDENEYDLVSTKAYSFTMQETYIVSKLLRADSIDSMNAQLAVAARDGWTYVPESIRELQGSLVGCLTANVEEVLEPIAKYVADEVVPLANALYEEKKDALSADGYRMINNSSVQVLPAGQLCASMMILDAARFRYREVDFAVAMVRMHKYAAPIVVLVKSSYPLRPASRACNLVYQS